MIDYGTYGCAYSESCALNNNFRKAVIKGNELRVSELAARDYDLVGRVKTRGNMIPKGGINGDLPTLSAYYSQEMQQLKLVFDDLPDSGSINLGFQPVVSKTDSKDGYTSLVDTKSGAFGKIYDTRSSQIYNQLKLTGIDSDEQVMQFLTGISYKQRGGQRDILIDVVDYPFRHITQDGSQCFNLDIRIRSDSSEFFNSIPGSTYLPRFCFKYNERYSTNDLTEMGYALGNTDTQKFYLLLQDEEAPALFQSGNREDFKPADKLPEVSIEELELTLLTKEQAADIQFQSGSYDGSSYDPVYYYSQDLDALVVLSTISVETGQEEITTVYAQNQHALSEVYHTYCYRYCDNEKEELQSDSLKASLKMYQAGAHYIFRLNNQYIYLDGEQHLNTYTTDGGVESAINKLRTKGLSRSDNHNYGEHYSLTLAGPITVNGKTLAFENVVPSEASD